MNSHDRPLPTQSSADPAAEEVGDVQAEPADRVSKEMNGTNFAPGRSATPPVFRLGDLTDASKRQQQEKSAKRAKRRRFDSLVPYPRNALSGKRTSGKVGMGLESDVAAQAEHVGAALSRRVDQLKRDALDVVVAASVAAIGAMAFGAGLAMCLAQLVPAWTSAMLVGGILLGASVVMLWRATERMAAGAAASTPTMSRSVHSSR